MEREDRATRPRRGASIRKRRPSTVRFRERPGRKLVSAGIRSSPWPMARSAQSIVGIEDRVRSQFQRQAPPSGQQGEHGAGDGPAEPGHDRRPRNGPRRAGSTRPRSGIEEGAAMPPRRRPDGDPGEPVGLSRGARRRSWQGSRLKAPAVVLRRAAAAWAAPAWPGSARLHRARSRLMDRPGSRPPGLEPGLRSLVPSISTTRSIGRCEVERGRSTATFLCGPETGSGMTLVRPGNLPRPGASAGRDSASTPASAQPGRNRPISRGSASAWVPWVLLSFHAAVSRVLWVTSPRPRRDRAGRQWRPRLGPWPSVRSSRAVCGAACRTFTCRCRPGAIHRPPMGRHRRTRATLVRYY